MQSITVVCYLNNEVIRNNKTNHLSNEILVLENFQKANLVTLTNEQRNASFPIMQYIRLTYIVYYQKYRK